ncbi:MAG: TIM-barrel domain-containing protein [Limnochordia bacterium]|jgi:alpha-D-xyloside xylohydrolase
MQLVHMPCGTHYFKDFGYERYPYRPLLGEQVAVQLMVENAAEDVIPVLTWEVDGTPMPELAGAKVEHDGNRLYFRFELGSFEKLSTVCYRFAVQGEAGPIVTKDYSFEVLAEEALGEPLSLLRGYDFAYALFARITLVFDWSDSLRVYTLDPVHKVEGTPVSSVQAEIAEGISLAIETAPFSWSVKRYTEKLTGAAGGSYRLLVDGEGSVHRLSYRTDLACEHLFGFGERFDQVDQKGSELLVRVVEHFTRQGSNSYLPIPFFLTERELGWFSPVQHRLWVDARDGLQLTFDTPQRGILTEERWLFGKPQQLIAKLHDLTGRVKLPPKWALGIWISGNGWNTQKETLEQLQALEEHQLPATAIVLEAWSDEQTFCIFNDAKYEPLDQEKPYSYTDFTFPEDGKWPDPKEMAEEIRKAGLNLVLWQIPVIKYEWGGPGPQLLSDEAYAIEKGYCVLNDDGSPYRITDHWFRNSLLLDFTNPEAVKWWFGKRQYLLDDLGVKGFKTDGGEFLFDDAAVLYSGETGETAHNLYPVQYVKAYQDFLEENGVEGVTFTRAGFTGAQTQPVHWAGDQLSEWSEFRAQLTAGLSAGISGIPFWSFDVGGFAGDFPSAELYLRSVAMAAFCPVMQWHSEPRHGQFYHTGRERWINDRSPWNLASLYKDESIISIYRLYANLHMNLMPYIYQEAKHCAASSRPLMAHMVVDFPEDEKAWTVHDQYMFGRDLLVAPITEEGAVRREIYLPEGLWHDLFLGGTIEGGRTIEYDCPMERIPVFVRDGAVLAVNLADSGLMGSQSEEAGVGNDLGSYKQLAFLCFGRDSFEYADDLGVQLSAAAGKVSGTGISEVLLVDCSTLDAAGGVKLFERYLAAKKAAVE